MQIYNLDVVEIPTNKPVVRIDHPDVVYKTEAGKFRADHRPDRRSVTKRVSLCWWAPSPLKSPRCCPSC